MQDIIKTGPSAIFNFASIQEQGIEAIRAVVVDKNGAPKPLAGVSVEMQTSYQVWDISDGDVLLNCSLSWENVEGSDEQEIVASDINVFYSNGDSSLDVEGVLDDETASSVMDFLTNKDLTIRYFTLTGYTDTVNGESLNEMYARRKTLTELFEDVSPTIRDRMVNFLDSPENSFAVYGSKDEPRVLSWDKAKGLPETISFGLNVNRTNAEDSEIQRAGKSVIVWYKTQDGEVKANYYDANSFLDLFKAESLELNYVEQVPLTDDIVKIMSFNVLNDVLMGLDLYHVDGIPHQIDFYEFYQRPNNFTNFPEVKEHLLECGMNISELDLFSNDLDTVESNTNGVFIPVIDISPNKAIEYLLHHYFPGVEDGDNEVTVYQSEDGNLVTIVLPSDEEEYNGDEHITHHSIIVYKRKVVEDENGGGPDADGISQ